MWKSNKKTFTNLNQEPDISVSTFEPIAASTYLLGSPEYKWLDLWANRQGGFNNFGFLTVLRLGLEGTASPPATRTLNGGYEYYAQVVSSTNTTLWQYKDESTVVQVPLIQGSMFFAIIPGSNIWRLYVQLSDQVRRYAFQSTS